MHDEDEDEDESVWGDIGMHFSFEPEFLVKVAEEGKDYRGEYGSYKYTEHLKSARKSSASVCLISDELVPVGWAHSDYLDGIYNVFYQKFKVNLPWKNKDNAKTFHLFSSKSHQYVKLGLFETRNPKQVPKLIHKAIQTIIDLTEEELSQKTEDLER